MAPTAAVSMAVLINLSMIVSVSEEAGQRFPVWRVRKERDVLLKPVLLRRK